ncbi:hypothetical protein WT36_22940 [Burkholderia territorii]|nr:hypothetical protein WT36_22940 [Burkholderia territorii]
MSRVNRGKIDHAVGIADCTLTCVNVQTMIDDQVGTENLKDMSLRFKGKNRTGVTNSLRQHHRMGADVRTYLDSSITRPKYLGK